MTNRVAILGSTGSIGVSTLDVIARHPDRYSVAALSANNNVDLLLEQCRRHHPETVVICDEQAAGRFEAALQESPDIRCRVLVGSAALDAIAADVGVDTVMAAIVGAAGLNSTLSAVSAGKKVLLANKESLVMAGHLFMNAVAESNATLLPIDSEHNAIFQCLPASGALSGVKRILLTGSGGPLRNTPFNELASVTPDQACAHPNWSMGRKISVDSATMMNKGLELIEAHWLFDAPSERIDIVVHPQSIIHSMVEYVDGSVLAQLGNPDMRTPIAHALAWPERIEAGVDSLDIIATARLDFEAPDEQRFPALRLARECLAEGGTAAAVLNAANEIAVDAFLASALRFDQIAPLIENTLLKVGFMEPTSLADVIDADKEARNVARSLMQ